MSRIQDILAKADRDGTARRLPSSSPGMGAPATVLTPHFDSSATLPTHSMAWYHTRSGWAMMFQMV